MSALLRAALRLAPAFALAALVAAPARAAFVTNGNFAAPPIAPNGVSTFAVGSTGIPGWTVISGTNDPGAGSVDLVGTGFYSGAAPGGGAYVDLDGTSSTGAATAGGLQQAIAGLTASAVYTVTFNYTNNYNASPAGAVVSIDGYTVAFSHANATPTNPNFLTGTLTFAAGGGDVLTFRSTDAATSLSGIILTNVSINASAVPEPGSMVLLGAGLATAALVRRARRRQPAAA